MRRPSWTRTVRSPVVCGAAEPDAPGVAVTVPVLPVTGGLVATPVELGEAGEARLHPVRVAAAAAARAAIRRERIGCMSIRLTGSPRRGYPGVGSPPPLRRPRRLAATHRPRASRS